jgi:hypothetical protein
LSNQPSRIEFASEQARKEFQALSTADRELARNKLSHPIPPNKNKAYHNGNANKRGLRYWHLRDNLLVVFRSAKEADGRYVMLAIGTHKHTDFFSDNYRGTLSTPLSLVEAGILLAEAASQAPDMRPEAAPFANQRDEEIGVALVRLIRSEAREASASDLEAAIDAVNESLGALSKRQGEDEQALADVHQAVAGLVQAQHQFARNAAAEREEWRLALAAQAEQLRRVDQTLRRLQDRSSDHTARLNQLDHSVQQADARLADAEHGLSLGREQPSWLGGVMAMFARCLGFQA